MSWRPRTDAGAHETGDNVYGSTPASLERWFMAYAAVARVGR